MLFKVWLKSGEEIWLLLHVEVQAREEKNFPERMYIYHYRIFDRYRKSVVSVAILADDDPNWRPSTYQRSALSNTKVQFEFSTIKLLDYANQLETLCQYSNPFAIVIWAHLESLKTRKKDNQRLTAKIAVTRALYDNGYSKDYILALFSFIDWVLALPGPLEVEYAKEIETFEQEKKMQYITSVERIGIQKGIQQGMQKGEAAILMRQLQRRFGDIPAACKTYLERADTQTLLELSEKVLDAKALTDVFSDVD